MQAFLEFNRKFEIGQIDPRIYGGFLEHIGRATYGGVYEDGGTGTDEDGFPAGVMELIRELQMPLVRYPGGNFVSGYCRENGIGPKDKRPAKTDLAWQAIEPNTFGTDEFMRWGAKVGTNAYDGGESWQQGTGSGTKSG